LIPVLLLVLIGTYILLPKFQTYLLANEEGICWAEKRKIPTEEIKSKALKELLSGYQSDFYVQSPDKPHARPMVLGSWRIIKDDYDLEEVLKLLDDFPITSDQDDTGKKLDERLKIEKIDSGINQLNYYPIEIVNSVIENNHMLVATRDWDHPTNNLLIKINTQKMISRINLPSHITPIFDIKEIIRGYGFYYFSIQMIFTHISQKNGKSIHHVTFGDSIFEVSNCGDSIRPIGEYSISTKRKDNRIFYTYDYDKYIPYKNSIFTLISSLVGFLKGVSL
jgi:hypothetical protein